MKLQALLEAIAALAAIRDRGLDHVDPAGAHRDGVTAVLEAAGAHHQDVEDRMQAIEATGLPSEAAHRLADAEAKLEAMTSRVVALEQQLAARNQPASEQPAPPAAPGGSDTAAG